MWYQRAFYRLHLLQNALPHLSFGSFVLDSYRLHLKPAVLPIKASDNGESIVAQGTISLRFKQTTPPPVWIFKIIVSRVVFVLRSGQTCVRESIGCVAAASLCSLPSSRPADGGALRGCPFSQSLSLSTLIFRTHLLLIATSQGLQGSSIRESRIRHGQLSILLSCVSL